MTLHEVSLPRGEKTPLKKQGQERHLGRTTKKQQAIGHFGPMACCITPTNVQSRHWIFVDVIRSKEAKVVDNRNFELCLCHSCASVFFRSPEHRIVRADPFQVIKSNCDCCRTRPGYDFILRHRTSNPNARKSLS